MFAALQSGAIWRTKMNEPHCGHYTVATLLQRRHIAFWFHRPNTLIAGAERVKEAGAGCVLPWRRRADDASLLGCGDNGDRRRTR